MFAGQNFFHVWLMKENFFGGLFFPVARQWATIFFCSRRWPDYFLGQISGSEFFSTKSQPPPINVMVRALSSTMSEHSCLSCNQNTTDGICKNEQKPRRYPRKFEMEKLCGNNFKIYCDFMTGSKTFRSSPYALHYSGTKRLYYACSISLLIFHTQYTELGNWSIR